MTPDWCAKVRHPSCNPLILLVHQLHAPTCASLRQPCCKLLFLLLRQAAPATKPVRHLSPPSLDGERWSGRRNATGAQVRIGVDLDTTEATRTGKKARARTRLALAQNHAAERD